MNSRMRPSDFSISWRTAFSRSSNSPRYLVAGAHRGERLQEAVPGDPGRGEGPRRPGAGAGADQGQGQVFDGDELILQPGGLGFGGDEGLRQTAGQAQVGAPA